MSRSDLLEAIRDAISAADIELHDGMHDVSLLLMARARRVFEDSRREPLSAEEQGLVWDLEEALIGGIGGD